MYMVIVMEYFPKGHLGNVVQNARDKKQPIPEEVSTGTFSIICAMKSTKNLHVFYLDISLLYMYLIGKNENHAHAIQFLKAHSKNIYIRIIKIYGWSIFLIPWIPFA